MADRVLMCSPLGGRDLSTWCGSWAKRNGRVSVKVPTTDNPEDKSDPKTVQADAVALRWMVLEALADPTVNVVWIFAHSRGCQVVGEWLAKWSGELTNAQASRVRIVLTGNLERARFGYIARRPRWIPPGNSVRTTPENTRFQVLDIGRIGDRWANYPTQLGGIIGWPWTFVSLAHLDYSKVNPDNLTNIVSELVVGNTRYVNVK